MSEPMKPSPMLALLAELVPNGRESVEAATGGEVKAWGRTHNEALQNLACGLDNWAEDWDESEPASQSVSTDQLIVMKGVTL